MIAPAIRLASDTHRQARDQFLQELCMRTGRDVLCIEV